MSRSIEEQWTNIGVKLSSLLSVPPVAEGDPLLRRLLGRLSGCLAPYTTEGVGCKVEHYATMACGAPSVAGKARLGRLYINESPYRLSLSYLAFPTSSIVLLSHTFTQSNSFSAMRLFTTLAVILPLVGAALGLIPRQPSLIQDVPCQVNTGSGAAHYHYEVQPPPWGTWDADNKDWSSWSRINGGSGYTYTYNAGEIGLAVRQAYVHLTL